MPIILTFILVYIQNIYSKILYLQQTDFYYLIGKFYCIKCHGKVIYHFISKPEMTNLIIFTPIFFEGQVTSH